MQMTRRQALTLVAATVATPALSAPRRISLRPEAVETTVVGRRLPMLAFNGQVPGPEIRLRQGNAAHIRLDNGLDDGALVHWHGLRVPNRMDGVNVLTQDVVIPGESFDYRFDVPDAGTYWYHSHYLSYEQVSRGLFGAFIVEERDPPEVDHDITVQLFDMLLDADGQPDDSFDPSQFATAGRLGNVKLAILSRDRVRLGDRLRLRFINPSIDRIYRLELSGLDGRIVALDGMPLEAPQALGPIVLAPGQRCDVIADVTGDVTLRDTYYGADDLLGRIALDGERPRSRADIPRLPANRVAQPGRPAAVAMLDLQGGAGAPAHPGTGTWALNDTSGLPAEPLLSVRRGTTVRIEIVNQTNFPHVMHLHGHHFYEITQKGQFGPKRDSTLLAEGETRSIIAVLDNPGRWMLHCHMLSHQADGMATWLAVS
jgi:FtsP/CotA-like multicopper oxidase with cupredoxin domain